MHPPLLFHPVHYLYILLYIPLDQYSEMVDLNNIYINFAFEEAGDFLLPHPPPQTFQALPCTPSPGHSMSLLSGLPGTLCNRTAVSVPGSRTGHVRIRHTHRFLSAFLLRPSGGWGFPVHPGGSTRRKSNFCTSDKREYIFQQLYQILRQLFHYTPLIEIVFISSISFISPISLINQK